MAKFSAEPPAPPPSTDESTPFRRNRTPRDRRLDLLDRLAARLISFGGASIVLAVIAIVLFVGAGALPLLRGASARPVTPAPPTATPAVTAVAVDEYQQQLLTVNESGTVEIADFAHPGARARTITLDLQGAQPTVATFDFARSLLAVGDARGGVHLFGLDWHVDYTDTGRQVSAVLGEPRHIAFFDSASAVQHLAVARTTEGLITLAADNAAGQLFTWSLDPVWETESRGSLPPLDPEAPADWLTAMAITQSGERLAVGTRDGRVALYDLKDAGAPDLELAFAASKRAVTAVAFLLGDKSLVVGDEQGGVWQWLPVRGDAGGAPTYVPVRNFAPHAAAVQGVQASPRDRSFLTLDQRGGIHLSHATAHRTYLELPDSAGHLRALAFAPKADGIVAVAADGRVLHWHLDNPHPEATLRTLFGKVWYEGYSQPEYVWQSTGGSDEFEPKLSLIPLIFGTLKGTFYAMMFSVPIALLAAIYVSQLARPGFRATVKPLIELMAAIPSVVVGFLAALWLAPRVQGHLIGTVLLLIFVPLFAVFASVLWLAIPLRFRHYLPDGIELVVIVPFILLGGWAALTIGPVIERAFFAGDVTQWLFSSQGIRYDQRNNIIVGLAMGFAVIPIIFTVSEDALSNVPTSLVSGALALGASRWQATWRIVLRAASPGIFAAIMLGLGRAVGETMIVLMATGNTPIMDWSIFNGMRTMSAAIAVEVPEAPQGGTLYRVLFATAFLLFVFTLLLNTLAGLVGARLRRRYGRF
jgi:phosphate transport system permease protein